MIFQIPHCPSVFGTWDFGTWDFGTWDSGAVVRQLVSHPLGGHSQRIGPPKR